MGECGDRTVTAGPHPIVERRCHSGAQGGAAESDRDFVGRPTSDSRAPLTDVMYGGSTRIGWDGGCVTV